MNCGGIFEEQVNVQRLWDGSGEIGRGCCESESEADGVDVEGGMKVSAGKREVKKKWLMKQRTHD